MYFSTPIDMIDTFEQFEQNKKIVIHSQFFFFFHTMIPIIAHTHLDNARYTRNTTFT